MRASRYSPKRLLGVITSLELALAGSAWAGYPTFNVLQIGFGNGPAAEVTADFNGDGKTDLAVANADGNTVAIYINSGSGFGLNASQTLSGTASNPLKSPQGIAAGDFNGDGAVDIAVTNYSGSSVSIFLNNGSGSFGTPTNVAVGSNPLGIATGKFRNSSTFLDLAVVVSGKVQLLLGNGDGTFAAQTAISVGKSPKRIVAGDFGSAAAHSTADGSLDVAITLNGEAAVAVMYGNGVGGLTGPTKFATDIGPRGIVSADFNNDGCPDLATANHNGSTANTVDVLFGCDSTGVGFSNAQQLPVLATNANVYDVAAVELNGDAQIDLVATQNGGSGGVALLQNNIDLVNAPRSARFNSPVICAADGGPQPVVVGNFDSGSVADLAVGNRSSDDVSIILGTGSTTCGTPTQIGQSPAKKPVSIALCNVTDATGSGSPDGSGVLDLLLLDQASGNVLLFGNDGNGNMTRGAAVGPQGTTATSVACAGHQNTDPGVPTSYGDFAVTYSGSNSVVLFCNQGNGVFVTHSQNNYCPALAAISLDQPQQVVFADFDSAGALDDAVVNKHNNSVLIASQSLGTGTTPLSVAAGRIATTCNDVATANNGAKTLSTFSNTISSGTCTGVFATNPAQVLGTNAPTWVASRDLNGDGIDDLVTANKGQDNVSVLLSSGGGSFASHVEYAAGNGADAVVVDDFDVDGKRDLAVADFSSDVISILPGASTAGTFTGCANNTPSCEYIAGDGPVSLVTGALNADTYPDLAVVDQNSGSVTILLNAYVPPTPTFTPTPCTGTCPTPTPTCSGSCGGC